jgi:hypothetical protein
MVIEGLRRLHDVLTPSPIAGEPAAHAFATEIRGWEELRDSHSAGLDPWSRANLDRLVQLEANAPSVVSGPTLLNFDVRADNIIIAGDRVFFVDWPWARVGAPFVEWLGLAPSVCMQGGPKPEELMRRVALGGVTDDAINAVIASLTGYFLGHALRPPPPGIPTVRAFQAAQGAIALAWLRERTGWS